MLGYQLRFPDTVSECLRLIVRALIAIVFVVAFGGLCLLASVSDQVQQSPTPKCIPTSITVSAEWGGTTVPGCASP